MKNFRYYIFWIIDSIKGSKVKRNYTEVKKCFEILDYKNIKQKENLNKILSYAVNNCEYYKNTCKNVNLKDFPIINKKIIIDNYDNFFSNEFIEKKHTLRTMSTSGSSGTPFKIYQDKGKVIRNKADLLFFYKLGGYDIGDRMYYLRIWNKLNIKSKFSLLKENFGMLDTSDLSYNGSQKFKEILLNDKSQKVILGYASSFTALVNNLENTKDLNWNIKSIFTGAEELPKETKNKMLKIFRCPVMSRYSNQENGILAQQPITGEDYFDLNEGSFYFEFLKLDADQEANINEPARIVVTDLFNKAVPMIRYDTGDICTYNYLNGKRIIKSIDGRVTDFLKDSSGNLLSPKVVSVLMWRFKDIKAYQFIQNSLNQADLFLVVNKNSNKIDYINLLAEDFKSIFGSSFNLNIEMVDDIPFEKSGKRKYIKSLIN